MGIQNIVHLHIYIADGNAPKHAYASLSLRRSWRANTSSARSRSDRTTAVVRRPSLVEAVEAQISRTGRDGAYLHC